MKKHCQQDPIEIRNREYTRYVCSVCRTILNTEKNRVPLKWHLGQWLKPGEHITPNHKLYSSEAYENHKEQQSEGEILGWTTDSWGRKRRFVVDGSSRKLGQS